MWIFTIFTLFCWIHTVHSLSGCDEVDIIWIVDTESIENYGSDIITFVNRIVDGYCNEYAGFSVVLYGDKVPSSISDIVVLKLIDTEAIALRSALKTLITNTLTPIFASVTTSNLNYRTVSLSSALSAGDGQTQPAREPHKTALFGADYDMALHDDSHRFFIFDYDASTTADANIAAIKAHKSMLKESEIYASAPGVGLTPSPILGDPLWSIPLTFESFTIKATVSINSWTHNGQVMNCGVGLETLLEMSLFAGAEPALIVAYIWQQTSLEREGVIPIGEEFLMEFLGTKTTYTVKVNGNVIIQKIIGDWIVDFTEATVGCYIQGTGFRPAADAIIKDVSVRVVPEQYVMLDSNEEFCKIVEYVSDADNDVEAVMVFTGIAPPENRPLHCNKTVADIQIAQKKTFVEFATVTNQETMDKSLMAYIGNVSCPAVVRTQDGDANLANHVQWIVPSHFIACNLVYISHTNITKAEELTATSYIRVKDYPGDGTTFKVNDYLVADKTAQDATPNECDTPVLKVTSLIEDNVGNTDSSYTILKLFVKLPKSPMEYIQEADIVTTKVPISDNADGDGDLTRRRRLFFNLGFDLDLTIWGAHWGSDFLYEKEGEYEKSKSLTKSGKGPTVTVSATGKLTLSYGYGFDVELKLYIAFNWKVFSANVHFEIKLYGYYHLYAYFKAEIEAGLTITIADILKWSKLKTVWLGPIPVVIRPFVSLDVAIEFVPLKISAGIDCAYKESFALGYYFDQHEVCDYSYYDSSCWLMCIFGCGFDYCVGSRGDCGFLGWSDYWKCRHCNGRLVTDSHPIRERTVDRNGCKKHLQFGESEEKCPTVKLGFTVKPALKVGISLYQVVMVYVKGELELPLMITVPQMTPTLCGLKADVDMCTFPHLQASFTIALNLNIYIGYEVQFEGLIDKIWDIITGQVPELDTEGTEYKVATIEILPETSLGCLSLTGLLEPINDIYRPLCCELAAYSPELAPTDTNRLKICLGEGKGTDTSSTRLWGKLRYLDGTSDWKHSQWIDLTKHDVLTQNNDELCAIFDDFKDITYQWENLDLVMCEKDNDDNIRDIDEIQWWDHQGQQYNLLTHFETKWINNRYDTCSSAAEKSLSDGGTEVLRVYDHINTVTSPECVAASSSWSATDTTGNGGTEARVSCPTTHSLIMDCGVLNSELTAQPNGAYFDEWKNECVALSGASSSVKAYAWCCNIDDKVGLECHGYRNKVPVYINKKRWESSTFEPVIHDYSASKDYTLTGCSYISEESNSYAAVKGIRVGPVDIDKTTKTIHHHHSYCRAVPKDNFAQWLTVSAIYCKPKDNKYQFDCVEHYGSSDDVGDGTSTAQCPQGYQIVGCTAWAKTGVYAGSYIENDLCKVRYDSTATNTIYPKAICCNLLNVEKESNPNFLTKSAKCRKVSVYLPDGSVYPNPNWMSDPCLIGSENGCYMLQEFEGMYPNCEPAIVDGTECFGPISLDQALENCETMTNCIGWTYKPGVGGCYKSNPNQESCKNNGWTSMEGYKFYTKCSVDLSDIYGYEWITLLSHKDADKGTFNSDNHYSHLENRDDPTANTYSNIWSHAAPKNRDTGGYITFKLTYADVQHCDGSICIESTPITILWKQTSWIEDEAVTGFVAIAVPSPIGSWSFTGLGESRSRNQFIVGGGGWNDMTSVGTIVLTNGGIPAIPNKIAKSATLYVKKPANSDYTPGAAPYSMYTHTALQETGKYDEYGYRWTLLLSHRNSKVGFFYPKIKVTHVQDNDDPTANTFCGIGKYNTVNYQKYMRFNGAYTFRLHYAFDTLENVTFIWSQTSWILDNSVTGYNAIYVPVDASLFNGLCPSGSENTYLSGNANGDFSVGTILDKDGKIPFHGGQKAVTVLLHVKEDEYTWRKIWRDNNPGAHVDDMMKHDNELVQPLHYKAPKPNDDNIMQPLYYEAPKLNGDDGNHGFNVFGIDPEMWTLVDVAVTIWILCMIVGVGWWLKRLFLSQSPNKKYSIVVDTEADYDGVDIDASENI